MKKLLAITLLLTIGLAACSGQWNHFDPNMPDGLVQQHKDLIKENLELFKEDSQNIEAIIALGVSYHALGDYKNAVTYYKKALDYDSAHIVALNNLADIYETMEDYETSAMYIMRLYEVQQDSYETINDTVRILLKFGDSLNAQQAVDNYAKLTENEEHIQSLNDQIHAWTENNQ